MSLVVAMMLAVAASATPEGSCMFDPNDGTYRHCAHASGGKCFHYTTPCEPPCWFDPRDGTYRNCAHASMGKCFHYTTTCSP